MGFIGVQPATVPLTSSDITDGIISTAKIADDAVGNTKLDLTADYAFTGTITGNSMDKLFADSFSSNADEYDISSTYINSSFDNYYIIGGFNLSSEGANQNIRLRVFSSGSVLTGNVYGYESGGFGASSYSGSNSTSYGAEFSHSGGIGSATGEGNSFSMHLFNVNSTTKSAYWIGHSGSYYYNAGEPFNTQFGGQLIASQYATIVNGLRFYPKSGQFTSGFVKIYGIKN